VSAPGTTGRAGRQRGRSAGPLALQRPLPGPPAPRSGRAATGRAVPAETVAATGRAGSPRGHGEDAVNRDSHTNNVADRNEQHTPMSYSVELVDRGPESNWRRDRTRFGSWQRWELVARHIAGDGLARARRFERPTAGIGSRATCAADPLDQVTGMERDRGATAGDGGGGSAPSVVVHTGLGRSTAAARRHHASWKAAGDDRDRGVHVGRVRRGAATPSAATRSRPAAPASAAGRLRGTGAQAIRLPTDGSDPNGELRRRFAQAHSHDLSELRLGFGERERFAINEATARGTAATDELGSVPGLGVAAAGRKRAPDRSGRSHRSRCRVALRRSRSTLSPVAQVQRRRSGNGERASIS
jgi:hypothetical protein